MLLRTLTFRLVLAFTLAGSLSCPAQMPWPDLLYRELPLLGQRNWIVVVDAAYPWQTSPGVEMIETGADQLEVVKTVLEALAKTIHVRPAIFVDAELARVPEVDAHGIGLYREELGRLILNRQALSLPHEQLLARLNEAGQSFHVLVLKTRTMLPYSSVFMQLECGYWNEDAEKRLRAAAE